MRPQGLLTLVFLVAAGTCGGEEAPSPVYDSPRLAGLARDVTAGKKDALAGFWRDVQGKAPLVEPVPDDAGQCFVTFLFRGSDKTRGVGLRGGIPGGSEFNLLTHMPGTDLWYRTQRCPKDARFTYFFVVDPPAEEPRNRLEALAVMLRIRFDPLNARTFDRRPMVELPDAPRQSLLARPAGMAAGTLTRRKISSALLKEERSVTVYMPPAYDPAGEPAGLLILLDGDVYERDIPAPVILDNLIAQGKIAPVVAVLVQQKDRLKELTCSEVFADFLARELVPWVRKNYRVGPEAARTVVGGYSAGGLMAAYCGLRHSAVFGNVLAQSGSFWYVPGALAMTGPPAPYAETAWLTREFVVAPRLPLRFYLEVGRFEVSFVASQLGENRRFRDVLKAKGYDVVYSEFNGGHEALSWRGTFGNGLLALLGNAGATP
jgi:enterochelin esterase family protein